jgi:hypothetical protein
VKGVKGVECVEGTIKEAREIGCNEGEEANLLCAISTNTKHNTACIKVLQRWWRKVKKRGEAGEPA